ncbi:MAG: hypothetical protein HY071_05365 [Chloroflexi bacterium]|nr:hypothetical protein [Chloroflexota bacterium]
MRATLMASAAAVLLVAGAVLAGLIGARLTAVPTPSPIRSAAPTSTPAPAFATPIDTADLVFQQPLSAGCATAEAVYVFSDGGGIGRFDGQRWTLIDPTLRTIGAAACSRDRAVAVGLAGRAITIDDGPRSVRIDTVTFEDLLGIGTGPDATVLAVGTRGTVLRTDAAWQPYARGIEDDLQAVAVAGPTTAWAVGPRGVTYRLDGTGWHLVPSGVTTGLRAVALAGEDVVAAGDGGVVLSLVNGAWKRVDVGTNATLRSIVRIGRTFVAIVGDGGTVIRLSETGTTRLDLGTKCDLRAVFARASEYWIVGSSGGRAGVWRVAGDKLEKWGAC